MMKSALVLLVATFSLSALAEDPGQMKMDPKKEAMMKKWEAYSTPGAPHKTLEGMTGNWSYTAKAWEEAKGKPEEFQGTSSMKMILGGRFLQQDFKGQMMGQPFEGMGLVGYDNLKKKYETVWLDNMATGMMTGTGTYDAGSKTLKDKGVASCPMTASKTRAYRSEWKMADNNNMSFIMWGPDIKTGKEFKQMEITYKRAQ
jgi:hypothetical protein